MKPFCQTEICFASKTSFLRELSEIRNKTIALIISNSALKRWNFEETIKSLKVNNEIILINNLNQNPTQSEIRDACIEFNHRTVDLIVAIGGGSVIDLAKGLSALYDTHDSACEIEHITKKIEEKTYLLKKKFIDIIAVPTTSGTGSELTQWATIWDSGKAKKYSVDSSGLEPRKAIIIPEFTLDMPQKITLYTGLDALSHAIESYWSIHSNPLIQEIAFRSIELNLENLPLVLRDLDNLRFREKMSNASVLAGLAFSQTRTTACHAISYPLTLHFNVPHGLAVAMSLSEVAKINKESFKNSEVLFELFECHGGLENWIKNCCEGISELKLSFYGVKLKDVDWIAENTLQAGRMENNPISISSVQIKKIIRALL